MKVLPKLTVVATNDFLASVEPWPTSYGRLPGAKALARAVADERSAGSCVWVDAGDFAQGGPLATETDGRGGFTAFAQLAPDVAAAGNHEFDWGVQHLLDQAQHLGFPLLCANRTVGFPSSVTLEVAGLAVGVVGLTHPDLADLAHAAGAPDLTFEEALAEGLRQIDGADVTIVAIHHGVPPESRGDVTIEAPEWWRPISTLLKRADVVVCGHTLGRFIGRIDDTPVLQPWAFGAELGICRISQHGLVVGALQPDPAGQLPADSEIVGFSNKTLRNAPGRDSSLQNSLAEAIRAHTGSDVGLVPGSTLVMQQPPIDGVLSYLPVGPVPRSLVQRLIPWSDDSIVVIHVAEDELETIRHRVELIGYGACGYARREQRTQAPRRLAVCLSGYLCEAAQAWLPTTLDVEPVELGLRSILINALDRTP